MAAQYGAKPEDFAKQINDVDRQYIGEDLAIELAAKLLVETAVYVD